MAASSIDTRFRVTGMDCAACATKVEAATRRVTGVEDVSVSVTAGTMTVRHAGADLGQIARKVTEVGYAASVLPARAAVRPAAHDHAGHDHDHDHDHEPDKLEGLHGHDHGDDDTPWYATPKARLTLL